MRSLWLLCVMLISANLLFAQALPSKALTPFEQELVNNQKQFLQAWQDKNVTYLSQAIANDFKGIAQNGDFYDKDEFVSTAHEGLPKGFRVYDIEVVRLDESCAVVAYNEIMPGERPRYRHLSDTWTKDGGRWKLKYQQLTPNLWSALDLD
jgi:hypothetical protein